MPFGMRLKRAFWNKIAFKVKKTGHFKINFEKKEESCEI
jgi:hypothetical protein